MHRRIFRFVKFVLLMIIPIANHAQVSISSDLSPPDSSAMLDIQSTTSGMLVPRMDSTQRQSIDNPAEGLLVYDLSSKSFWVYSQDEWTDLSKLNHVFDDKVTFTGPSSGHESNGFVVGSPKMKNDSIFDHHSRMFFDKVTGAFRVGTTYDTFHIFNEFDLMGDEMIWDRDSLGLYSIAAGIGTNATGDYGSAAIGFEAQASGDRGSIAMGNEVSASGDWGSIALGYKAEATGSVGSVALGSAVSAHGNVGAIAMGTRVKANGNTSVAIGAGFIDTTFNEVFFTNNIYNSLMVGFNTNIPTLFVGPGSGTNTTGKIGINTGTPLAQLEVLNKDISTARITSTFSQPTRLDLVRSSTSKLDWRIENDGNLKLYSGTDLDADVDEEYRFSQTSFKPSQDDDKDLGAPDFGWKTGYFKDFLQVSDQGVTGHLLTNSTSTLLGSISNHNLDFFTNGVIRQRITADGKVGIGTTSPNQELTIVGNGGIAAMNFKEGNREIFLGLNSSDATLRTLTNHQLSFWTNNSRRMTIGTDGNIGIGTSAPEYPLHIDKNGVPGEPTITLVLESNTSNRPLLLFSENASAIDLTDGMSIEYDGSGGGSSNRLRFNKIGGDAAMTVENGGHVGIGISDPSVALDVSGDIEYTGTITDVSDQRAKDNIHSITNVLDDILILNPVSYTMRGEENSEIEYGLLAQEVQSIFPNIVKAVDPEKDLLGLSYIQLIPILVSGMQEQQEIIEQLECNNAQMEKRLMALEKVLTLHQNR